MRCIPTSADRKCCTLLFALSAYLAFLGFFSMSPLPVTYDPAMHAEIAGPIISGQIYPTTWSPLADTGYTYPPLFHWSAFLLSLSGLETINAVILIGVLLYALFPILLYKLGSLWGKRIGILAALAGALTYNWTYIFLAGEYPQLLGMNLAVVFLYYYLKKDPLKAGLFLGLSALAHPFVPVYLVIFVIIHALSGLARRNPGIFITAAKVFSIALLVSAIWLPQYVAITKSATTHQWRNVRWYYEPGFVGPDTINSFFLGPGPNVRINPAVFLFSVAGIFVMGFRKPKESALLILFLFTMAFSLFHVPGTQYKFPDMLSLVIPVCSAIGMAYLVSHPRIKKYAIQVSVILAIIFLFSAYSTGICVANAKLYPQKFVSTPAAYGAALWLRQYDPEYSRILKTGEDDVWFSITARKYAMDPQITDLEVLTEKTNEQMADRDRMIELMRNGESVSNLVEKHGIRYVITEGNGFSVREGSLIYDGEGLKIYKF